MANKDWSDYFSESFQSSAKSAMEMQIKQAEGRAKQTQRDMLLEASLFSKGIVRIDDPNEIKALIKDNKVNPTAPSNTQGQFANYGNNVLRVGDKFFKYSPDADTTVQDLAGVKEQLDQAYNTGGTWNPSSVKVGNAYYKFTPTESGKPKKQLDPVKQYIANKIAGNTGNAPEIKKLSPKEIEVRQFIAQAIQDGTSAEELAQGITEEGFDPAEFSDMFNPVAKTPQNPTQSLLGNLGVITRSKSKQEKI